MDPDSFQSQLQGGDQVEFSRGESSHKYVVFSLGDEQYGISIAKVREIVKWEKVTRLPQSDRQICGVRDLRGRVVPIMSLRICFGLPESVNQEDSKIMILEHDGLLFGAVVDSVDEVMEVEQAEIKDPPSNIIAQQASFMCGITKSDAGLTILIDVDEMLSNPMHEALSEALA